MYYSDNLLFVFIYFQVDAFSNFPETNTSGNRPKLLKSILHVFVDKTFLSGFTWTGKTYKGQIKNAFKDFVNITQLVYSIESSLDAGYTRVMFESHLKQKILKYASE